MNRCLSGALLLACFLTVGSSAIGGIISFDYSITLVPGTPTSPRNFTFKGSSPTSSVSEGSIAVPGSLSSGDLEVEVNDTLGGGGGGVSDFATLNVSTDAAGSQFNISITFAAGFSSIGTGSGWVFLFDNFVTDDGFGLEYDFDESASSTTDDPTDASGPGFLRVVLDGGDTGSSLGYIFATSSAAPEPATFGLIGLGLVSAWVVRRRRHAANVDDAAA